MKVSETGLREMHLAKFGVQTGMFHSSGNKLGTQANRSSSQLAELGERWPVLPRNIHEAWYRVTSLIRNNPLLGPYSWSIPRVLW
jgi:hypothetical protein